MDYHLLPELNKQQASFFIGLFLWAALVVMFNRFFYASRFSLHITRPNVYIFEYESHSQRFFSLYNILNFLFQFLTCFLVIIAITGYFKAVNQKEYLEWIWILFQTFKAVLVYFMLKKILSFMIYLMSKKRKEIQKMTVIKEIYATYTCFYFFIGSFLIYFFPYKSKTILYVIIFISISWLINNGLNTWQNLTKHLNFKSYQLFLYLCLTEILPLIILIWWISFQII